jgi:hypothetical protein
MQGPGCCGSGVLLKCKSVRIYSSHTKGTLLYLLNGSDETDPDEVLLIRIFNSILWIQFSVPNPIYIFIPLKLA